MVFNYDGLYYGAGANMTYLKAQKQPQCNFSKNYYDSRCQEYFKWIVSLNETITQSFPPTNFIYSNDTKSYVSFGFCKKYEQSKNIDIKHQIELNKHTQMNPFTIICNSFNLEKKNKIFETINKSNRLRIIFEPITLRVVFQSDLQIFNNTIISIQESYLNRLNSKQKQLYFLKQINDFKQQQMFKKCNKDKNKLFNLNEGPSIYQFDFQIQNNQYRAILQSIYVIDSDKNNKFCYKNNLMILTIVEFNFLQEITQSIQKQTQKIKKIFLIVIYLVVGLYFLLNFYYSKYISAFVFQSIDNLTIALKKVKISEDTNYSLLFEDKTFLQNFQKQSENLQLSSDMSIVYEIFQDLFLTLIFMTQNLIGQNESLALIELTKQIQYFQKLKNMRALGICYNNIGNIHFNNNRFEEAYDYYCRSIVCCQYEMNFYKDLGSNLGEINPQIENFQSKINEATLDQDYSNNQNSQFNAQNVKNQSNIFSPTKNKKYQKIKNSELELISTLFTRKYNCFKAVFQYMMSDKNKVGNWDLQAFLMKEIQDLNFLQNGDRPFLNQKNKIVYNIYLLLVYANAGLVKQCEEILKDNENIYYEYLYSNIGNAEKSNLQIDASFIKKQIELKQKNINSYKQPLNSEQSYVTTHSQKSKIKNTEQLKLNLDKLDIQKNLDSIIHLCYLSQRGIYSLINKQYKQAADNFTQIFEQCPTHSQHVKSHSFYQLYLIFQEFNLSHPLVEKIFNEQINEFSYKISFIYIDYEEQKSSFKQLNEDLIIEQFNQSYSNNSIFFNNEYQKCKKQKAMKLCQNIVNTILKKDDDYFGLIYSSLEEMRIQQRISMINYKFIQKNYESINQLIQSSFFIHDSHTDVDNLFNLSQNSYIPKDYLLKKNLSQNKSSYNNKIFEQSFNSYKTFEQSFENNQSQCNNQSMLISQNLVENSKESSNNFYQLQPSKQFSKKNNGSKLLKNVFKFNLLGLQKTQKEINKYKEQTQLLNNETKPNIDTHLLLSQVTQSDNLNVSQKIRTFEPKVSLYQKNFECKHSQSDCKEQDIQNIYKQNKFIEKTQLYQTQFQDSKDKLDIVQEQSPLNNLIEIENNLIKKRNLFYFSLRKAIQQLAQQFDEKSIHLKLFKAQFFKEINKTQILDQQEWRRKQGNIQEFFISKFLKKQKYQNCIIAVVDDLYMIQENDPIFERLIKNLSSFEIELCILLQSKSLSMKEQNVFKDVVVNNKVVVSFFVSEVSLQIYLDYSRNSKYHDKTPMFFENF